MDAFLNFHASGFWLAMALILGIVAIASKPYLPSPAQPLLMPLYWVLTPYLALIAGGVSPRLMGLSTIDWALSLRIGLGFGLGVLAFALLARAASSWTVQLPEQEDAQPDPRRWLGILASVGLCGAEEFFWSFLRGATAELFVVHSVALDAPGYWAVWLAALLGAPIAALAQSAAIHRLVKLVILAMTSVLFFYTYNFWLCWALHALSWMLLPSTHPGVHKSRLIKRSRLE